MDAMDPYPTDDRAAILRDLVRQIDERTFADGDTLLQSLLAFAWPSERLQDH